MDLDYDMKDMGFSTDDDEDQDQDFISNLVNEGILGATESSHHISAADSSTLKSLLHGLTLAEKGHTLLAKGCNEIKSNQIDC